VDDFPSSSGCTLASLTYLPASSSRPPVQGSPYFAAN
jgi:hypothetical protein